MASAGQCDATQRAGWRRAPAGGWSLLVVAPMYVLLSQSVLCPSQGCVPETACVALVKRSVAGNYIRPVRRTLAVGFANFLGRTPSQRTINSITVL